MTTLSGDQFLALFRDSASASRLEYQTVPVPEEAAVLSAWQDGKPLLPSQFRPWQDWLDYIRSVRSQVTRVRLVDEPPTPYQAMLTWAVPYHDAAGDKIWTMPRSQAEALGVKAGNWWLFLGGEQDSLVTMTPDAAVMTLITRHEVIARHRVWWDLAYSRARELQLT
jgi:hypothetical protein